MQKRMNDQETKERIFSKYKVPVIKVKEESQKIKEKKVSKENQANKFKAKRLVPIKE